MGIPKFFRWLSERYPLINQIIDIENHGPEIENFYLDMNGIVHNCTHGNNDDIFKNVVGDKNAIIKIFQYIENLFNIVRPTKLLYLALDGVAPRAKMNQQRQRRFKSSIETKEKIEKLISSGEAMPDVKPFDSNCITPGTEFMHQLSEHIRYLIRKKNGRRYSVEKYSNYFFWF